MENQHDFVCSDCGEKWQGGIESENQNGTYCPCPHCLSVQGSFHVCCEKDKQDKTDAQIAREQGTCMWCHAKDDRIKNLKNSIYCEDCQAEAERLPRPNKAVGTYVRSGGRV